MDHLGGGAMVSSNAIAAADHTTTSGCPDVKAGLGSAAVPNDSDISEHELHCAFRSQAHTDELRAVSSTHYPADIRQCGVFDGDQENARVTRTEFVVTEKIFRMLPEDEKLLWHGHNGEVGHGLSSSPGNEEVANTYGRVMRFSQSSTLPPALSQLLASSVDPGMEKRRVSFAEDQVKPQKSSGGLSQEETRSGEEQGKSSDGITPNLLGIDQEDDYLNDAVHRPVVHHKSSHVPALTERMPDAGQFISETRSARF